MLLYRLVLHMNSQNDVQTKWIYFVIYFMIVVLHIFGKYKS